LQELPGIGPLERRRDRSARVRTPGGDPRRQREARARARIRRRGKRRVVGAG
jgi:hypothetical protein